MLVIYSWGAVIVLFVSMSFSAFFVSAKEKDTPDHESTYIYYKSIKIEKGDTLWDIANENLPENFHEFVEKYQGNFEKRKYFKINHLIRLLSIAGGSIILLYKIQSSLHHGLKLESYHGNGHGDRKSPARWLKKLIK